MEPWTPSDAWIDRINKARRFLNQPKVMMAAIVFNWIVVAVSTLFAMRSGDGRWLLMAIFWTVFAAYVGPRQYEAAKAAAEAGQDDDEAADADVHDDGGAADAGAADDSAASADAAADAPVDASVTGADATDAAGAPADTADDGASQKASKEDDEHDA